MNSASLGTFTLKRGDLSTVVFKDFAEHKSIGETMNAEKIT